METKPPTLDFRDSASPPSLKFESSPTQINSNNQQNLCQVTKNGIIAFATLALQSKAQDPPKMTIKQLYVQQYQSEYPNLLTDEEKDVKAYLENISSIVYPNGFKTEKLQIKTIPPPPQYTKSSSQSPTKKGQQGQIDTEALEVLKQYTIAHYTITTSLGQKRYVSYLICQEPQLQSNIPQTNVTQGQTQFCYFDYVLMPFTYIMVQDSPAFEFGKKVLKGVFDTSLLPYYQMVCIIDQSQLRLSQNVGTFIQPLKIEFLLCYLFKIVNRQVEDAYTKNLSEFLDSGSVLTYEDHLPIPNYEIFYRPNISYKLLLSKISVQNILHLLNCLLLYKKLILISRDSDSNALIIQALLDLLYPLNSQIYLNISYLKIEMVDYLDSPMPYIIGINEAIWNKIGFRKWNEVSDDTVCFEIDIGLFTTKVDLPNHPEPMTSILSQTMQEILKKYQSLNDRELKIYLRQAIFNYILLIINDFRPYRVNFKEMEGNETIELFSIQKDNNFIGLDQIFKFDSYLESQQIENYEFYAQFKDTQLFNDFLERALRTNADKELNYFISCLDILKHTQSFNELLKYQQTLINQIIQETQLKQANYIFTDLIQSYERALNQFDKSIYIRTLPLQQNNENGLFQFNQSNIQANLYYEIQKQGCIRNLIKRPSTTKRIKPSKKSDLQITKHSTNFTTNQIESRNQSNSIKENQQILSQVYFQKGPQKVSTPKGLPSEMKSIGNFLSEDDSKSTNSKDHKGSQEENKSENSSFKSFFRFTFEKIQSKLKTNKAESSQPLSQTGTPQKQVQLLFDIRNINVQSLSGIQKLQKEIKRPSEGPLINQPYYMQNSLQQRSIFSTAFGPKSGPSFGRPKCYSETASSQIKGAFQTSQIPSNVHYQIDSTNLEARPSAISISNKSFHDSPSSQSYLHESFATATKVGKNIVNNNNSSSSSQRLETQFKTQSQRDTPISQGKSAGSSGQKVQGQQQLAYPFPNSGIVILKDINRNTKKFVQKININLDPEDERNRRYNQRIQTSMHNNQPQITQSLSNSNLPGTNLMVASSKTLNSSRSGGGGGGITNTINKTQLSTGLDSPTNLSQNQSIKTSDKKIKNPSFKQAHLGPVKQNSGGRQKAISYNQPTQSSEQNLRRPQQNNIQIASQQNFKQQQTKAKVSVKIKRESDVSTKQQANQNISSLVQMKKHQSDKNTPITQVKMEKPAISSHQVSSTVNSEYMVSSSIPIQHQQQQMLTKKSNTGIQKQQQIDLTQEDTFNGAQQRMRSISYQMNQQPEFQSHLKYKMKKDKSQKSLMNSNSGNIQSPSLNKKDPNFKFKAIKSGNQTTKMSDKAISQVYNLQNPKSQLQNFNEYTSFNEHQNLHDSLSQFNKKTSMVESYEPSAIIDSDLLDTPKMKFDALKLSVNLGSSINFEMSPTPNLVGQINPTIVRQDEQFGIYERNSKYNNDQE